MSLAAGHVVIVGGTRGLGKVVAERFSTKGYLVTILSRQKQASVSGVNSIAVDLENISSVEQVVSDAIAFGGSINYLIFCQRYRGEGDSWQGELQVSLTATKLLIEGFSGYFNSDADRAICVVSSVYAEFVGGSQPDSYHVAKAGLNQLVKFNSVALGKIGIRTNAIMPLTYLKQESKAHYLQNTALMDLYRNFVPLKRMAEAEDSANLIEFLCSEKASFINGQAIYVDGGVSVVWPEELARTMSGL